VTVAGLIKVIQQALVGGILHSRSNKAHRLAFITIFGIRVVIACLPTPASISMVNKFQLLQALFY
jgi:hypothetical protein